MNTTLNAAQQLLRQGRIEEAEYAYAKLLEQSPNDVEALNIVALSALREGRVGYAQELLCRAAVADPQDPVTQHHLGRTHEVGGNYLAAVEAYGNATRLRADFYVARLHLAAALEHLHEFPRALLQYSRALKDAQQQGRWLNPATTPEVLRPLVEQAVLRVRGGRRGLLFGLLEPLAQRYGRSELARVDRCLRVYLNEEQATFPDPRQQPTFLYFPGLPPTPYFDCSAFDWLERLESSSLSIRRELLQLLSATDGRERVFDSDDVEQQNLRGAIAAPSWNGYYFYRHGERREDNCVVCPVTIGALDVLPLARIREHAPEAFFSVFSPGTHLLPHRGVTNTRVVGHLPLLVPNDCALNVGGEVHHWQEGKVVVFDDTYEHEAWNRSQHTRVVLIFDLWNPWLSEIERAALAELVAAIGDFRKAVDAT